MIILNPSASSFCISFLICHANSPPKPLSCKQDPPNHLAFLKFVTHAHPTLLPICEIYHRSTVPPAPVLIFLSYKHSPPNPRAYF